MGKCKNVKMERINLNYSLKIFTFIFPSLKYLYLLCFIIEHSHYIIQLILKYITLLDLLYWIYLVDHSNCLYVKVERINLNCSLKIFTFVFSSLKYLYFFHADERNGLRLKNISNENLFIDIGIHFQNFYFLN